MATNDSYRPMGDTPASDASAASAPEETQENSSNADLRIADIDSLRDAAITATGEDIDNDHADERPEDRSDNADAVRQQQQAEREFPDDAKHGDDTQQGGGQYTPTE